LKILNILIISVVALLSIAAGLAKVMQAEQEMQFLQSFGLSIDLCDRLPICKNHT